MAAPRSRPWSRGDAFDGDRPFLELVVKGRHNPDRADRDAEGFTDAGFGRVGGGNAPDHPACDAVVIDDFGAALPVLAPTKKIRAAVRRVEGMLKSHFSGKKVIVEGSA